MLKYDKICVGEHTATEQEKIFKTLANCMLFTAVDRRNHTLRINIVYYKKQTIHDLTLQNYVPNISNMTPNKTSYSNTKYKVTRQCTIWFKLSFLSI